MKALKRCRNNIVAENVDLIDLDTYNFSNVIDLDGLTINRTVSTETSRPKETYIYIDDDDSPVNHHASTHERNFENGASSSRRYGPDISPVKLSKGKRTYSGRGFSAQSDSESSSDDDDSLDCEYMEDFSGKLREEWEKASLKRKNGVHNGHYDFGMNKNKQKNDQVPNFNPTRDEKKGESSTWKDNSREDNLSDCDARDTVDIDNDFGLNKNDQVPNYKPTRDKERGESSFRKDNFSDFDARANVDVGETHVFEDEIMVENDEQVPTTSNEEESGKNDVENADITDDVAVESSIIDQREKLKETEEYRRALEEELSARQIALKIQAEEAQQLRRMQKRKKAETLRLLDMERRQKQRVEEIRETQKKDEENMNLKEKYRTEVRQQLKKLEMTCLDMASLLRGLGIQIGNGVVPSSHEVRAAYKRALLSFHPDRSSGSDMRQQVEAEEKFKLISRMKEKLSL